MNKQLVLLVDVLDTGEMGRLEDLSNSDKGQIAIARQLGLSISETARLVVCSSEYLSTDSVCHLSGEVMALGCTMGRKQADGGSTILSAMFCWVTPGLGFHVDVTLICAPYLNITADQVHTFMAIVYPNSSGLYQQDNVRCHFTYC